MLWSSNNLIITIITLCTIIHEMKTRCGRDEINMWEWIQLEDNLPDDLKKKLIISFSQISDFGLDQRSQNSPG